VLFNRLEGQAFCLSGSLNHLTDETSKTTGFLLILRDVTDLRKEELVKRNFLSLISHKLKTPLVTIAGYTPLLLEQPNTLTDFQKKALTTIHNQGVHLSDLVDELITFSVLESETLSLDRKPISPKTLVEDAQTVLKDYFHSQKAVLLNEASLDSLPSVTVDGARIREVLRHLLENAVKFNRKDEKRVWISGTKEGDFVQLNVRDDGMGIPREEQGRIFQKFYQIEESFTGQVEGAGLGLALAKRIITAHGGTLHVTSEMGQGSVFSLTIPL
jgi:signal transduction histidine kinase